MQLALPQIQAHLQKGLRSLYTLHGDEALLVQEAADAIRAAARSQGFAERSVHVVSGAHFDWSEVLAAGGSMSLFADKQLLEIRMPTGKPGKEGSPMIQQLAQTAEGNDSTLTLFILPRLDNATKKGAWFGALDQYGVTVQIDSLERAQLPQWIAQRLKLQGQSVVAGQEGQNCLQFFADRVEGNLLAAHQEIQKLGLLYPAGELTQSQVEIPYISAMSDKYSYLSYGIASSASNEELIKRFVIVARIYGWTPEKLRGGNWDGLMSTHHWIFHHGSSSKESQNAAIDKVASSLEQLTPCQLLNIYEVNYIVFRDTKPTELEACTKEVSPHFLMVVGSSQ